MNLVYKKLRYYYWLLKAFFKKNLRSIIVSCVGSFFLIFLIVNFYPYLSALILRKHDVIGIVGTYKLQNPPSEILNLISNPLINVNDKGQIVPLLINKYEISKDQKIYRFHLKPNLYWSNKTRFTARDIRLDLKGTEMKVIDDLTIEFHLDQPLSIFPIYLTKPLIKYPLIGIAGLYDRQSYKSNRGTIKEITLVPNKKDFATITYKMYTNEDVLGTAYKKGEIRLFKTNKKTIADSFNSFNNTIISKTVDYTQIITLFFNTEAGMLEDKDVRKALVEAIPNNKVFGQIASGPIPPTSWAFYSSIKQYPFDPEKSRTVIEKNATASAPAQLSISTFYDYIDLGEDIKKSLENIGVKVTLKVLSYIPPDFEMLLSSWSPPTDPDQYFYWHSTQAVLENRNITHLKSLKVDNYLEKGRAQLGVAGRKAVYPKFQKAIMDEVPAHFMYYPYEYTIERK